MVDEQQAVPVAQEDREAAADMWERRAGRRFDWHRNISRGMEDDHYSVQAFARHRLASLPCKSGEGADAIAAAIKATEYKYFGDYEMSDGQREAVDTLVEVARNYLRALQPSVWDILQEARDQLEYLNGRWPTRKTPAIITRINTVPQYSPTLPDATQTREAELVAALEFYADRDSDGYRVDVTNYGLSTEEGEIVRDGGARARAALNARGGA